MTASKQIKTTPYSHRRWKNVTHLQRFERHYIPEPNSGCWLWMGAGKPDGYGRFHINSRLVFAHRFSFLTFKGALIEGMVIDHLCRNTSCVNPDHLDQVTPGENTLRSLHAARRSGACRRGHPRTEENSRMEGKQFRCRVCDRLRKSKQGE